MRIDVLTLFPEMLSAVLGGSIIGNAQKNGVITLNYINIRDFSNDPHNRVDDYPYGGGTGMVMMVQPIYDAYVSIVNECGYKPYTVYMSPQGKVFTQQTAERLSEFDHIVILCGHYEGVDERVLEEIVDAEISIGDFVLTGGEIPAMAVIDALARLLPGTLSDPSAFQNESLQNGLLEYPQYTRPDEILGKRVPEVLLSGHHKNIEDWRADKSLERTKQKRPDLLK